MVSATLSSGLISSVRRVILSDLRGPGFKYSDALVSG